MACCGDDIDCPEVLYQHPWGPHQQGYDYEFIPVLDSKYECSICLLCQREPTQTTCGHRFCRDCILTWLRSESQRCPEDNSPITPQDVFPDNFAKREILCLKARCPNTKYGCQTVVELGQMEEHQKTCDFRTVSCPSGCPMLLLQQDVCEHVAKECLHRIIECSLCFANFPLNEQQTHFETCPMVSLQCNLCQANHPRQEHLHHLHNECPYVIAQCPFKDVGCKEQVTRSKLQDHLNVEIQYHLQLLNTAHGRLRFLVDNLATSMNTPSAIDYQTLKEWGRISKSPRGSHDMSACPEINIQQLSIRPSMQESNNANVESPNREFLSVDPKTYGTAVISQTAERSLLSSAEGLMKELFQRNVQLEQRHREQEIKMGTLGQRLAECETHVALMSERLALSEARFCNGMYLWNLEGFSRIVQEARNLGHSRLLHSPGFYTSAFGYKLCLRLNIITKEHIAFLSLFIHLMHGEFDESLTWPFTGSITFSILDHSEHRQHITETMTTKPTLVAFQRPMTDRNPKGFGYMEFVAVETLLKGGYVCNDHVLIKAIIKVAQDEKF